MKPIYTLGGALIVITILVLVFIGIFKPNKTTTTPVKQPVVLADHATENIAVSYMIDGSTTATEKHRSIKITVTNSTRILEVFSGYQGQVIKSKSYPNDAASYKIFLSGLQTIGFIKQSTKNTSLEYSGKCPLGNTYLLTTSGIKDAPELLWSTTCEKVKGNFTGNLTSVKRLFQEQIPDYKKLVAGVDL